MLKDRVKSGEMNERKKTQMPNGNGTNLKKDVLMK